MGVLPSPFSEPYVTGALVVAIVLAVMASTGPEEERQGWTFALTWTAVAYIAMMLVYL